MKKRYFKFVQIDSEIITNFLNNHPNMQKFIKATDPFYVRVGLKPYASLIHNIISQDASSKDIALMANKLAATTENKITAKRVNRLSDQQLLDITNNQAKANLIRQITSDVITKKINLKKLIKLDTQSIINTLSYKDLTLNTIKQFALFGCFKQDVLCEEDLDFIEGLKIYLNKKDIVKQDIINIKQEYGQQLTLFSLCMWRIKNERIK